MNMLRLIRLTDDWVFVIHSFHQRRSGGVSYLCGAAELDRRPNGLSRHGRITRIRSI
jgi:hypothetical protein